MAAYYDESDCVQAEPTRPDERIVAVDHLVTAERERDSARRSLERAQKALAVAEEAHASAAKHLHGLLGV